MDIWSGSATARFATRRGARAERRAAVREPARLDPATRLAERSTARTARSAATQALAFIPRAERA
jgi:hypothetical protein